jgi:hypothetical protein
MNQKLFNYFSQSILLESALAFHYFGHAVFAFEEDNFG